jgi:hypothetical protein
MIEKLITRTAKHEGMTVSQAMEWLRTHGKRKQATLLKLCESAVPP